MTERRARESEDRNEKLPDLRRSAWRWLVRATGRRTAIAIALSFSLIAVLLAYGPTTYTIAIGAYSAYRTNFPKRPNFSPETLNIGVAIFNKGGFSTDLYEQLAVPFRLSTLGALHPIQGVRQSAVADLPYTWTSAEQAIEEWVQETGAQGALWGYEESSGGSRRYRLRWTRGSYADDTQFLDRYHGLAAYISNNWLGPPSIELPTLYTANELVLPITWLTDFTNRWNQERSGVSPDELPIEDRAREELAKIRERVCARLYSAECRAHDRALVEWSLVLPSSPSEVVNLNSRYGEPNYPELLRYPITDSDSIFADEPRTAEEFRTYIQRKRSTDAVLKGGC